MGDCRGEGGQRGQWREACRAHYPEDTSVIGFEVRPSQRLLRLCLNRTASAAQAELRGATTRGSLKINGISSVTHDQLIRT